MPFDTEQPPPIPKVGLKGRLQRHRPEPAPPPKEEFEQAAQGHFDDEERYKSEMWDLSIKFKSFIESRILVGNRGPLVSNLEKEVLEKLSTLAIHMNEDELQPHGMGSTALCMLLMKCMLLQRDTINTLNYRIAQLEHPPKNESL